MEDMSGDRNRESPRTLATVTLPMLLASLLAAPGAPAAPPVVYHSANDDGTLTPEPVEIAPGAQTVHLYIDGGPVSSAAAPCHQGTGDEVCSWELTFEGQSGLDLVGFTPAAGGVFQLSSTTLTYVGGNPINGSVGPTKLGDLAVQGVLGGSLRLLSSKSVNSSLGLDALASGEILTVPEPGVWPGLLSGLLLLRAVAARRRRRSARPARLERTFAPSGAVTHCEVPPT